MALDLPRANIFIVVTIDYKFLYIENISYLDIRFTGETNKHEQQNRPNVVVETGPIVDLESRHEGPHQHKEYSTGTQDGTTHKQNLVPDVRHRDVIVDLNGFFRVHKKVHDVCYGRRYPSASLIEEFIETFWSVGVRVRGS